MKGTPILSPVTLLPLAGAPLIAFLNKDAKLIARWILIGLAAPLTFALTTVGFAR